MPDQWKGTNQILISYRREDTATITGRIYDRLVQNFGREAIFKDVNSMMLGRNFRKQLDQTISKCAVVLVVIGEKWLGRDDESGKSRLDDPQDFVRIEIESALKRDIPVIPLLVQKTLMPDGESLPESLRELCYRHGLEVGDDPHFHVDISRLIDNLEIIMKSVPDEPESSQDVVFDTLPGSLPQPAPCDTPTPQKGHQPPKPNGQEADAPPPKPRPDAPPQEVEKIGPEPTPKLYIAALFLGMLLPSALAIAGAFAGRRLLSSPSIVISEMTGVLLAEIAAVYGLMVTGFLIGRKSGKSLCRVAMLTAAFPLAINLGGSLVLLFRGSGGDTTWFFLITAFCMIPIMPLFAYIGLHLGMLYSSRKAKTREADSIVLRT